MLDEIVRVLKMIYEYIVDIFAAVYEFMGINRKIDDYPVSTTGTAAG